MCIRAVVFSLTFCTCVVLFQILWVIQVSWLQWLLVMIGMTLSGAVLVLTVAPAFANDKKQVRNNCFMRHIVSIVSYGTVHFVERMTYWYSPDKNLQFLS